MPRLLAVLPLLALVACGGGGPTAPTTSPSAPGPVPTIDGWTDQVRVAEVTPAEAVPGTMVTVRAPGYLTREQVFDGAPVALWPADEAYTTQVVYGWSFDDGRTRLVRWERPFVVSLEGALAGDAEVVAKLESTLAELRRLTGLQAVVGSGGEVTIGVDGSLAGQGAVGDAHIDTRGSAIVSARVRLVSRDEFFGDARSDSTHTLLHELGHVVGLWHSPSAADVMHPGGLPVSRQARAFSVPEQVALHMMYAHRRPGNLPADREAGVAAAGAAPTTLSVVD